MTLNGGVNHLCLLIALNNSEILEKKKTDNTFKVLGQSVTFKVSPNTSVGTDETSPLNRLLLIGDI